MQLNANDGYRAIIGWRGSVAFLVDWGTVCYPKVTTTYSIVACLNCGDFYVQRRRYINQSEKLHDQ